MTPEEYERCIAQLSSALSLLRREFPDPDKWQNGALYGITEALETLRKARARSVPEPQTAYQKIITLVEDVQHSLDTIGAKMEKGMDR